MSAMILLASFLAYTILLFIIAWLTSCKIDRKAFYIGSRQSSWGVVAYGMIGASLSGVTFLSIPGNVYKDNCYYTPIALSFFLGYMVVAFVLLPLYYRLNLTSIYTYLEQRFGFYSYKTGAVFFILSRIIGAAIRTYVVIMVLHFFILKQMGIPFWLVGLIFILLAILYTYRGGVKTIVWTDTFQTTFILLAIGVTIFSLASKLDFSCLQLWSAAWDSHYSNMFCWDWSSKSFVPKHMIAGILIPIVMTGLDQGMMQKMMSCKSIREAQKSMVVATFLIIAVIMACLFLGVSLAIFCDRIGLMANQNISDTDHIFPEVVFHYLGPGASLCFFIGLISAAYPTCANALTALTTSVCIDLLELEKKESWHDHHKKNARHLIQWLITLLFFGLILIFHAFKGDSVINILYWAATYTYGPLLALYTFGLSCKRRISDRFVPAICFSAPLVCFFIEYFNLVGRAASLFHAEPVTFSFGFSLLLINAVITYLGLLCFSNRAIENAVP